MSKQNAGKADKAREIIEKFPHTSKKELGKMLFKLYPAQFKDEEDGRDYIRAVTGTMGDKTTMSRLKQVGQGVYKGLPQGIKNDYSNFFLEPGKWGVLSDVHIPYHDEKAVNLALEYFKKKGIKNILLNGDIIDCYQVSDHLRDPSMPMIDEEFKMLGNWLWFLSQKFNVVYKLGNHEERFERYVIQKGPALWRMEVLSWEFLVHTYLKCPDVEIVKNKRIVKAGKLSIVHGHEFGRQQVFNPVNPSRGYFLRAKASVLGGDKHQSSEHTESDINGNIIGAWSTGCLCELHPQYLPINRWNLGFATVEFDGPESTFEVTNLKIVEGKVR